MPSFFESPILNSPYDYPSRHWELDETGQPTERIADQRRRVSFITPVPRAKKRKASPKQAEMVLDEGKGLSTEKERYESRSIESGLPMSLSRYAVTPDSEAKSRANTPWCAGASPVPGELWRDA